MASADISGWNCTLTQRSPKSRATAGEPARVVVAEAVGALGAGDVFSAIDNP